jgi:hypothetical protein
MPERVLKFRAFPFLQDPCRSDSFAAKPRN